MISICSQSNGAYENNHFKTAKKKCKIRYPWQLAEDMILVVELESNSELQCGKHTVITSYEITSTESIDMNGIFCLYALM